MSLFYLLSLALVGTSTPTATVDYEISIDPRTRTAGVECTVSQDEPVIRSLAFKLEDERFRQFSGSGLKAEADGKMRWDVPDDGGRLEWVAQLVHVRGERTYDARITPSWGLFRGEDIVPTVQIRRKKGARLKGTVKFDLPKAWTVVGTFGLGKEKRFKLPSLSPFPAPRGWAMAGKVDVLSVKINGGKLLLASPSSADSRLHETAAFLRFTLPEFTDLLGLVPERVVVVRAGDPMWRGGLSGPRSLYLHLDRPMVTRDKTSPLLHELFHVMTSARSKEDSDWAVEGLAEWAALEVLRRTGGLSKEEHEQALAYHRRRGRDAGNLLRATSRGATTHKAVGVIYALDRHIQSRSEGEMSLDVVVQKIAQQKTPFNTEEFLRIAEEATELELAGFFKERGILPKLRKTEPKPTASGSSDEEEDETESETTSAHEG